MPVPDYPDAVDPDAVGEYDVRFGSGGGFVWDAVLEYRVWCHPKDGSDDFYYPFASYAEALAFSERVRISDERLAVVEEPLALIVQEEYIEETTDGEYLHVRERRITEWPPEFLARPRRTPQTIPDFLSAGAPPNRLDILRGLNSGDGAPNCNED